MKKVIFQLEKKVMQTCNYDISKITKKMVETNKKNINSFEKMKKIILEKE